MTILEERDFAHVGSKTATFRNDDIKNSTLFRQAYEHAPNVVSAEDQPFENSPDGLIKHLVHEKMNTREQCVDAYMLFLKEGARSGKHRHMWEEVIFVAEGSGYDLHWDVSSTASTPIIGSGKPSRRSPSGSAATSSTSRLSRFISISIRAKARRG